jgi:hypothetical protein
MNGRAVSFAALGLAAVLGVGGYLWYQDTLVPVPLAPGQALFVTARPEFGEDQVVAEALMPAGAKLDALLAAQSDLSPLAPAPDGGWAGQLLGGLQGSRHGKRWRLTILPGWRLQDGALLDAARLAQALAPEAGRLGGTVRPVDGAAVELRFPVRRDEVPTLLAQWRVPGTGPFRREGLRLVRFEGFIHGRAGLAGLQVSTDPAQMESRAWAEGLAAARWAWAAFPGKVEPEDMAKVRLAPYDEVRMKDGSVWFLSRRMRRLRPDAADWTRTPLFGAWKGAMDLPYEPEPGRR